VKNIGQRILGLINTIITGLVTGFVMGTYFSGTEATSRCEYCSLMIYPGLIFFLLFIPGVYTLFCNIKKLNRNKKLLNILNSIGILLSAGAIAFNLMSSSYGNN
jgi:hypothetical protein